MDGRFLDLSMCGDDGDKLGSRPQPRCGFEVIIIIIRSRDTHFDNGYLQVNSRGLYIGRAVEPNVCVVGQILLAICGLIHIGASYHFE